VNTSGTLGVTKRAKAGQGKAWFYGLNPARLAAVRARVQDGSAEAVVNLRAMFEFTEIYLGHARDLAKAGQKDAARNWVRFFECSHVLDVLADAAFDVSGLRGLLTEVSAGCHPEDVPSWETDMQAIRATLNEILFHVTKQESSTDATANAGGCHDC
jgi:hypothetical protein